MSSVFPFGAGDGSSRGAEESSQQGPLSLVLHIGRHKTGTTAIQSFLSDSYDELLRHGFLYPKTGRRRDGYGGALKPHHASLFLAILNDEGAGATAMSAELEQEIATTYPQRVVLSSEVLSRESVTQHDLERIKSLLPRMPIQVVVYLRRQDDIVMSRYAERVVRGRIGWPRGIAAVETEIQLDYAAALAPVCAVFGSENVLVRSYDAERNNIIDDFLAACAIGCRLEGAAEYRRNVRPLWGTLEAIRLANALPLGIRDIIRRNLLRADKYLRRTPLARRLDRPMPLSTGDRDRILSRCHQSNHQIERAFFAGAQVFPLEADSEPTRAASRSRSPGPPMFQPDPGDGLSEGE